MILWYQLLQTRWQPGLVDLVDMFLCDTLVSFFHTPHFIKLFPNQKGCPYLWGSLFFIEL
jgi:hypothetical protein